MPKLRTQKARLIPSKCTKIQIIK